MRPIVQVFFCINAEQNVGHFRQPESSSTMAALGMATLAVATKVAKASMVAKVSKVGKNVCNFVARLSHKTLSV